MSDNNELNLREIQIKSLSILYKIDEICRAHNLDYFVMYGTLIGAIRHQGFIPWDDDIDIMMPRKDYDKLDSIIRSSSYESSLKVFTRFDDKYPYMIPRISDIRYYLDCDNEEDYGIGLFVDVYPIDEISSNYFFARIKGKIYGLLSSLYFLSTRKKSPYHTKKHLNLIKKVAYRLSKIIGKKTIGRVLAYHSPDSSLENDCYVGCIEWMTSSYKRNIFEASTLRGRVRVPFENIEVNIPKNYHKILTDYYGDYMSLPSKCDQVPHHFYKAYEKKNDCEAS